ERSREQSRDLGQQRLARGWISSRQDHVREDRRLLQRDRDFGLRQSSGDEGRSPKAREQAQVERSALNGILRDRPARDDPNLGRGRFEVLQKCQLAVHFGWDEGEVQIASTCSETKR